MKIVISLLLAGLAACLVPVVAFGDDLPKVVKPKYDGTAVPAPKGALVLFDGSGFDHWRQPPNKNATDKSDTVRWKLEKGYMEIVKGTGMIHSREKVITSGHLHVEWATPAEVKGNGQGRGNSGVFIDGFPEVQVLDSYENTTYPDGQAGALYKRSIPLFNACRKPGEWQCYDIKIERAKIENGKVVSPARITVVHNGVLIQDKVEFSNGTQAGHLHFQDHGNPVRYRNIWFKED